MSARLRSGPPGALIVMLFLFGGALCEARGQLAGAVAHYRKHGNVSLNDLDQTPGIIRTSDKKKICSETTPQFRDTKVSTKQHVCMMYGLDKHCFGRDTNEIDHLVSLEIGGADDIRNLWPQSYAQHPGAHEKDALENHLHKMICDGEIDVATAQKEIARDWYALYLSLHLDQ